MTDISAEPAGDPLDPDLPEQGIDTGAVDRPDDNAETDDLDPAGTPDPNADLMRADHDPLPDEQVPGAGPDGD